MPKDMSPSQISTHALNMLTKAWTPQGVERPKCSQRNQKKHPQTKISKHNNNNTTNYSGVYNTLTYVRV